MRIKLALLCVLAASLAAFSQEKSFDLNKYKFPDYKRHQLELNFNANGSGRAETVKYPTSLNTSVKYDTKSSHNRADFQMGYEYDKITRKRIDYLSVYLSGNFNNSKYKSDGQETTESNTLRNINLNGSRRYYLLENSLFLEGMTNLNTELNEMEEITPDVTQDRNSKYSSAHMSVGLGFGLGRIEKVSDLWQAYYILEKLNKQNSFSRQLDEKDVYEFATLASQLKNKRFLDFRTRRIQELKGLDSLLHEQGLIKESDISYFATLNDYWSYGNFPNRESGIELKFNASPDLFYANSQYTQNTYSDTTEFSKTSLISSVSFTWTRQLNLFWEHRFNATLSYDSMLDTMGHSLIIPDKNIKAIANFGYGFYPNSRTDLHANLTYMGQMLPIIGYQDNVIDKWSNLVAFNLTGNYYFSPHLQLLAGYSISYTDIRPNSLDVIDHSYNLSLRYAIF